MSLHYTIRPARTGDASRLRAIYSPYVLHTAVTPAFEIPSLVSFEKMMEEITSFYPFLVILQGEEIKGYAYGHKYRDASGHRWSAETSIYMAEGGIGIGLAPKLYEALLGVLALQGLINVFAGIVLPNERSIAFHKKMGFATVGTFKKGIFKTDDWHDVQWMQLSLQEHRSDPPLPRSWGEAQSLHREEIEKLLDR